MIVRAFLFERKKIYSSHPSNLHAVKYIKLVQTNKEERNRHMQKKRGAVKQMDVSVVGMRNDIIQLVGRCDRFV